MAADLQIFDVKIFCCNDSVFGKYWFVVFHSATIWHIDDMIYLISYQYDRTGLAPGWITNCLTQWWKILIFKNVSKQERCKMRRRQKKECEKLTEQLTSITPQTSNFLKPKVIGREGWRKSCIWLLFSFWPEVLYSKSNAKWDRAKWKNLKDSQSNKPRLHLKFSTFYKVIGWESSRRAVKNYSCIFHQKCCKAKTMQNKWRRDKSKNCIYFLKVIRLSMIKSFILLFSRYFGDFENHWFLKNF